MLGNVTVNGVKGAYVGYRKDGDMSTWENISFLNNPDNIQWNVKVGNMTGNAGKNSIGDFSGDGKDDLLVRQYSTGMLGYYANGDFSKWNEMGRGVDMNWAVIA